MSDAQKQPDGRTRKTEPADPTKPFTVRAKLGQPVQPALAGMDASVPRTFANAVPIKAVYDAATEQLRRDTAIALIVGHMRMLAQVLAIDPGSIGDIMSDATLVFDREDAAALTEAIAVANAQKSG